MARFIKSAAAALAALALPLGVTLPANADSGVETFQIRVSFADLNLDSEAGARTLLVRIDAAAREGCGPARSVGPLAAKTRVKTCRAAAVEKAVRDINAPQLTALVQARAVMTASR